MFVGVWECCQVDVAYNFSGLRTLLERIMGDKLFFSRTHALSLCVSHSKNKKT